MSSTTFRQPSLSNRQKLFARSTRSKVNSHAYGKSGSCVLKEVLSNTRKFLGNANKLSVASCFLIAATVSPQFYLCAFASNSEEALKLYQTALNIKSSTTNPMVAIRMLDKAGALDPKLRSACLGTQAVIFLGMDEYDKAKERAEMALRLDPKCANAWYTKAFIARSLARSEALPMATLAVTYDPKVYSYHKLRGELFLDRKQYAEAEKSLRESWHLCRDMYETLFQIGIAQMAQHKYKETIATDDEGIRMANEVDERMFLHQKAKALEEMKRYPEALAILDKLTRDIPDARQFHQSILRISKLTGDKKREQKALAAMTSLDDDLIGTEAQRAKYEKRWVPDAAKAKSK